MKVPSANPGVVAGRIIAGPAEVLEQTPPGKACRLSIIIPAWNQAEILRKTLPIIIRESGRWSGVEIILADNRSLDSTLGLVREFPQINYLPVSAPGANHARNGAAHGASGEILVFLDGDCLPQPGWLNSLTQPLREKSAAIVCGAALAVCVKHGCRVPAEDLIPQSGREDIFENNFAVLADLFHRAGGFNVHLGPVGRRWRTHEGLDLLRRIREEQPGARWAGVPEAVVHHLIQTRGGLADLGLRRSWWGGWQFGQQFRVSNPLKPAAQASWNALVTLPFYLGACLRRSPGCLGRLRNKVHRTGESLGCFWNSLRRVRHGGPKRTVESLSELHSEEGWPTSFLEYREVWPEARISMRVAERQIPFSHPYFSQTASYRIPPRGVGTFESALVMANPVAVITREGCLLGEVSMDWGRSSADHAWFRKKRPDSMLSLPGTSALLASTGGDSFYHWLLECLPRLAFFGKTRPDRWVVNDATKPFVRESLAMAGIPTDKIFSLKGKGLVECERLVVPALPGPTGFPHPRAVAWLRDFFQPFFSREVGLRLCLQRTQQGRRNWLPSAGLQQRLNRSGFQTISLENLGLKDQAALISRASEILAPHGAALAWLALAPESCWVTELVPAGYPNPCFYRLSRIRKLHHTILFSEDVQAAPRWDLHPSDSHFPREEIIRNSLGIHEA